MFRKLVSFEEAKRILAQNLTPKPVGKERVSLSQASNRVLATDIASPFDVPPFDRSTVDGYAVKGADTFGADEDKPVTLKLIGQINVGESPKVKVEKGIAVQIVTGAPMPVGADAVVMIEHTAPKNVRLLVYSAVAKGENVMKAGSDIRKGETVLTRGTCLSSRDIGVLAALGFGVVEVFKRPKVAIISTGGEVVEVGKPLQPAKIYDINMHTLSAAVAECGGESLSLGIVPDEAKQMRAALKKALSVADLVITSGGVSVGPTDIIPKVLNMLGKPGIIVYGMAVRPGRPTTMAVIEGKPIFSLPGHPTSALLIFHLFVRSVLAKLAGKDVEQPLTVRAVTSERLFSAKGRRTFITVTLKRNKLGKIMASAVPTGLSGAITTLTKADGFVEIGEDQQFVDAGETVTVELFEPEKYYTLVKE